jgi:uncharacterized protein (UPF0332 family)
VTREGRQDASADELRTAREELSVAATLLDAGFARVASTRIYFAVFHAARGLLYSEGMEPRTHEGVHHLFNLHFVKTGRFEPATSRMLAKLQKFRESADYSDSFVADAAGTGADLDEARAFVLRVEDLVRDAVRD